MFLFGHLGIGSKIVSPWTNGVPRHALLFGTVLPDLIDKPLYYSIAASVGHDAARQSLISGTRTFGHTAILLAVVVTLSLLRSSRLLAALAIGMGTHLLIDNIGDKVQTSLGFVQGGLQPDGLHALLWPLLGWQFPVYPFTSALAHFGSLRDPWILGGEIVGIYILVRDYRKRRNGSSVFNSAHSA